MDVIFSEKADKDFEPIDQNLRRLFIKHIEKITNLPPRKHMKHGIPHHVGRVTRQARLVCEIEDSRLIIVRCFKSHKDYENWSKSYK